MTSTAVSTETSPIRGFAIVALMMATATLVVGQLYAYLPFLPQIADSLSTSQGTAGLSTTVFALSQAAGFLVVGLLNRAITGRTLLTAGLVGLGLASLMAGYALDFGNLPAFFFSRGLQGLSAAAFPPLAIAAIVETNAPRYRPTAIALFSASLLMAAPLGQLLASEIASPWSPPAIFFASAAALALIAFITALSRFGRMTAAATGVGLGETLSLLRISKLGRLYAVTFSLLMGVVFYYASIQTAGTGVDLQVFRLVGSPAVLMTLAAGALLYRWPAPTVLTLGLGIAATGALVTGLLADFGLQLGHWLLLGGVAVAVPAMLSYIGQQPAAFRAGAILLYTFILFAGASLGNPAANALADTPLMTNMTLLFAVYAAAALVVASYRRWPARIGATGEQT